MSDTKLKKGAAVTFTVGGPHGIREHEGKLLETLPATGRVDVEVTQANGKPRTLRPYASAVRAA